MENFIKYGRQSIDEEDIAEVVAALRSDFLTQGPRVAEFENAICEYTGAKYCVALANATAGLHIAVAALELENGCEGITSPITFVASSNAFVYNGLKPVFADIDSDTGNIDPAEIKKKCTAKTRVIIPVHFAGRPCRMSEIQSLADEKNLIVIEDAAHAIGSAYPDGGKVGNCQYSDMTVFSFHPVKTITTGEGGAITTNSKELYDRLVMLRSHGITKDPDFLSENPGPWFYEMQSLGFNYRMTDLQAALGTSQLNKLEKFKARRDEIIWQYNDALGHIKGISIPPEDDNDSCFHLYVVRIDFQKLGITRKELIAMLHRQNIGTQVHYIPVHTQPFYRKKYGYGWGDFPVAEKYYSQVLSLPLYPGMTKTDSERVIDAIRISFKQ